jgi:hypothetical protein
MRPICKGLAFLMVLSCGTVEAAAAEPGPPPADGPPPASAESPPSGEHEGSREWALDMPELLDIGLTLGMGSRLDDAPLYEVTGRQGLLFGLGLDLFFSRRVSVGLGYEHLDLGAEDSGLTPTGSVALTRDLNSLWANLRLYAVRGETVGAFIRLGLGSVWQSADLTGSVWSQIRPDHQLSLNCEGCDSANMALRADLGIDVALSGGLRLLGALGLDSYRLGDELLDDCVPGAGSAAVFGLRTGFAYGAEL